VTVRGFIMRGITRRFMVDGRVIEALRDVNLSVQPGRMLAVVGHSGCGKTTLLRQIAGLDRPDAGTIAFSGVDGGEVNSGRIGMVFQEARLLPWKTVLDNLTLALRRLCSGEAARERALSALRMVGLQDFAGAWPHQLSGGMAQRVALARALCRDPDILLLDEPFGALDALTRVQLHEEFMEIRMRRPFTAILVTHDIPEAVRLADEVAIMKAGRIIHRIPVPEPQPRPYGCPVLAERIAAITHLVLERDAGPSKEGRRLSSTTIPEDLPCVTH